MNTVNSGASRLWQDSLRHLYFLRNIPDPMLRLYVGFGYHLGAPIEKDLWAANYFSRGIITTQTAKLLQDYHQYSSQVPSHLQLSEIDPSAAEFSVTATPNNNRRINTDIVRIQVEIANLYKLGLLHSSKTYLEIGAGYGALCAQLVNSGLIDRYIIVDLPEVIDVSRRWLSYLRARGVLRLTVHKESVKDPNAISSSGVYFIESSDLRRFTTGALKCDVLVNMNSFCEMKESTVADYLKHIDFYQLYSSNREKQFMNDECKSVSDILRNNVKFIWPQMIDYQRSFEKIKKCVFVGSNSHEWRPPQVELVELNGLGGAEMPSIFTSTTD